MSMAEIQEAAEIITGAVSPSANIIFGATLKPEMEDELVITVIATGFDSESFQQEEENLGVSNPAPQPVPEVDENVVKDIDLELDREKAAEEFAADDEVSMWDAMPDPDSVPNEEDDDTPAFLRRRKKNED